MIIIGVASQRTFLVREKPKMKNRFKSVVALALYAVLIFGGTVPSAAFHSEPLSTQVGRAFRIVPTNGSAGSCVFVPLELNSQGDETGFTLSLNFDPNVLSISDVSGINQNPDVLLGSDAPPGSWVTVNATQVASGRIGVFLSSPTPFVAGARNALLFKFFVAQSAPVGSTPITFGDQPIGRSTSASGQGVSAVYTNGSVTIGASASGIEGDINRSVAGVPGPGDTNVDNVDLFWYSEFATGQHCPDDLTFNEFQRLDANDSGGIDAGDYTYIFNTWINLTAKENAKGPTQKPAGLCLGVPTFTSGGKAVAAGSNRALAATSLKVISMAGDPGETVLVPIQFEAQGIEVSTGFSLQFDPNVLQISGTSGFSNPDVIKGPGASPNQQMGVNATGAATGKIGIGIDFTGGVFPRTPITAGSKEIAYLRFTIKAGVPNGTVSEITFTNSPVAGQTVATDGSVLTGVAYSSGSVMVGQAAPAPAVSVGGRVVTPGGSPVSRATVTLTDSSTGERRSVLTTQMGFFTFSNVPGGKTYTVNATSKRYRFPQKTLTNLSSDLTDVNFTGLE